MLVKSDQQNILKFDFYTFLKKSPLLKTSTLQSSYFKDNQGCLQLKSNFLCIT